MYSDLWLGTSKPLVCDTYDSATRAQRKGVRPLTPSFEFLPQSLFHFVFFQVSPWNQPDVLAPIGFHLQRTFLTSLWELRRSTSCLFSNFPISSISFTFPSTHLIFPSSIDLVLFCCNILISLSWRFIPLEDNFSVICINSLKIYFPGCHKEIVSLW